MATSTAPIGTTAYRQLPMVVDKTTRRSSLSLLEQAVAKLRAPQDLLPWINQMPKGAELHIHTLGAVYAEELLELSVQYNLYFDLKTNTFTNTIPSQSSGFLDHFRATEPVDPRYVPAKNLKSQPAFYDQYMRAVSMRHSKNSQTDPHYHFMYECFTTIESIFKYTDPKEIKQLVEIVRQNAKRQNIRWTELMMLVSHLQILTESSPILQSDDEHRLAFIAEVVRVQPLEDFKRDVDTACALIQKYPGQVLSLNPVGPEDDPIALAEFEEQMAYIQQKQKEIGMPLTIHAGELTPDYVTPGVMSDRIRRVAEMGVKRIGHGVCLRQSERSAELLQLLRERQITVEICLSSNANILGVEGRNHPIKEWVKGGVPVVICSDDPGVNRADLNDEFIRLITEHGFSLQEIVVFTRRSLESSFLKGQSIFANGDMSTFTAEFEGVDQDDWIPNAEAEFIIEASPRAKAQVRHERDLVEFFKKILSY